VTIAYPLNGVDMTKNYEIVDWAGNLMFNGMIFTSFEDAWDYVFEQFPDATDEDLGEFEVIEHTTGD
jgi:hypothetical protein